METAEPKSDAKSMNRTDDVFLFTQKMVNESHFCLSTKLRRNLFIDFGCTVLNSSCVILVYRCSFLDRVRGTVWIPKSRRKKTYSDESIFEYYYSHWIRVCFFLFAIDAVLIQFDTS